MYYMKERDTSGRFTSFESNLRDSYKQGYYDSLATQQSESSNDDGTTSVLCGIAGIFLGIYINSVYQSNLKNQKRYYEGKYYKGEI